MATILSQGGQNVEGLAPVAHGDGSAQIFARPVAASGGR